MVKAYLRYEQADAFGVITSGSNVVHDASGKHVLTAALENVAVWNLKQGTLVSAHTRQASCTYDGGYWPSPPGEAQTAVPAVQPVQAFSHLCAHAQSSKALSAPALLQIRTLTPPAAPSGVAAGEVTRIALTADGEQLAAGHSDGSIHLWKYTAGQCQVGLHAL